MSNPTAAAVVGANVRAEMARAKVTQSTIGLLLGVSQSGVSARLRGETPFNVDELLLVANYLEVGMADLFFGTSKVLPAEHTEAGVA